MAARIKSGGIEAVVEERGAELVSLADRTTGMEFLWNGDPAFWARRAPILFPVVGKLRNDSYLIEGRQFRMTQHGFARDLMFEQVEKTVNKASFALEAGRETLETFPFRFGLKIDFEVDGRSLTVTALVRNRGVKAMPFSIGFHPGFRCPFEKGGNLQDYGIFFEETEKCERLFLNNGLVSRVSPFSPEGRVLPLSEALFEQDALILKGLSSKSVILGRLDEKVPKIQVSFAGLPYLGIWKRKGAPFVCIEPWQGLADHASGETDFFKKEGIVTLPPEGSFSAGMTISLL